MAKKKNKRNKKNNRDHNDFKQPLLTKVSSDAAPENHIPTGVSKEEAISKEDYKDALLPLVRVEKKHFEIIGKVIAILTLVTIFLGISWWVWDLRRDTTDNTVGLAKHTQKIEELTSLELRTYKEQLNGQLNALKEEQKDNTKNIRKIEISLYKIELQKNFKKNQEIAK